MTYFRCAILLLVSLLFCACQGGYQAYLPAPHEMAVNAALAREVKVVPEEQVRVQQSQAVASDVMQALMKARGYVYIGKRSIRSEYAPSASSIRKAASELGASQVVYFVTNKEQVRERRSKMQLDSLVSDLIGAKNSQDIRRAGQRATKIREYTADVTYYTYAITYWARDEGGQATILTKSETLLLADEFKKLHKELSIINKKISKIERKRPDIRNTVQYVHSTTVVEKKDDFLVAEYQAFRQQQEKILQQMDYMKETMKSYEQRHKSEDKGKGRNPFEKSYDVFRDGK